MNTRILVIALAAAFCISAQAQFFRVGDTRSLTSVSNITSTGYLSLSGQTNRITVSTNGTLQLDAADVGGGAEIGDPFVVTSQLADDPTNVVMVLKTAEAWTGAGPIMLDFQNGPMRRIQRADGSIVSGYGVENEVDLDKVGWFPDGSHVSFISSGGPSSFEGQTVIISDEDYHHTLYVDERFGQISVENETVQYQSILDGTGTNSTRFITTREAVLDPLGTGATPGVFNRHRLAATGTNNVYSAIEIKATDTVANGTGLYFVEGATTWVWRIGSGTPEGVLEAPVGSLYTRTDGGAGTTLWVKESGSGNTGWIAK